jgi:hypothetical protein
VRPMCVCMTICDKGSIKVSGALVWPTNTGTKGNHGPTHAQRRLSDHGGALHILRPRMCWKGVLGTFSIQKIGLMTSNLMSPNFWIQKIAGRNHPESFSSSQVGLERPPFFSRVRSAGQLVNPSCPSGCFLVGLNPPAIHESGDQGSL